MKTENNIDEHVKSEIVKQYLCDNVDLSDEAIEDILLDSSFSRELDSILSEMWDNEQGIKNEEAKKKILINIKELAVIPLRRTSQFTIFFRYAAAAIIVTIATYTTLYRDNISQDSIKSAAVTELPQIKDTTKITKEVPTAISGGLVAMAKPEAKKESQGSIQENSTKGELVAMAKPEAKKESQGSTQENSTKGELVAMAKPEAKKESQGSTQENSTKEVAKHIKESDIATSTPRTIITERTIIEDVTYTASKTLEITLADGSNVILQKGGSLSYGDFNDRLRKVTLNGKAFFAVAKSKAPFIVESNGMNVMVTGTEFTIENYKNDNTAYIIVTEGSVTVETPKGMRYGLSAGNELAYYYLTNETTITSRTSVPVKVTTPDNKSYKIESDSKLSYDHDKNEISINHTKRRLNRSK